MGPSLPQPGHHAPHAQADPPAVVARWQAQTDSCHLQVHRHWGPRQCWMHCPEAGPAWKLAVAAAPVPPGYWKTPCRYTTQLCQSHYRYAVGVFWLQR